MDWLLPVDPALWQIAQTPTPAPASPEVELLKSQLEFLKWTNTGFLGFLAFLGAILTWVFSKNLEDAKRLAKDMVRQELLSQISPLIQAEAETVMRSLKTEQVIGEAVIDYYLPAEDLEPNECRLLRGRGFSAVRFWSQSTLPNVRLSNVLVVDFVHSSLLEIPGLNDRNLDIRNAALQQREKLVNDTLETVVRWVSRRSVLLIYIRPGAGRIEAIDQLTVNFPTVKYYTSANTPVALMGAAVDSAYVAYGEQHAS